MRNIILICSLLFSTSALAGSKTLFVCSVGQLGPVPYTGVRLNVIQSESNGLRANLIFGSTVSGEMFSLVQVSPGEYRGTSKSNANEYLKLSVSNIEAQNQYVKGYSAGLEAVYKDLREASGLSKVVTRASDSFVCGEKNGKYSYVPKAD